MVEPIMFMAIGFIVASLLMLGVIPLVHARAVRLTVRRLESLTPLSMAETRADKNQLRAEPGTRSEPARSDPTSCRAGLG